MKKKCCGVERKKLSHCLACCGIFGLDTLFALDKFSNFMLESKTVPNAGFYCQKFHGYYLMFLAYDFDDGKRKMHTRMVM